MAKINRNDPCPCGSGKKYKKCCYENDQKGRSERRKGMLGKMLQSPVDMKNAKKMLKNVKMMKYEDSKEKKEGVGDLFKGNVVEKDLGEKRKMKMTS